MMIKLKTILDLDTIYETVDFQLADNVAKKKRWAMGNEMVNVLESLQMLLSSKSKYIYRSEVYVFRRWNSDRKGRKLRFYNVGFVEDFQSWA